MTCDLDDMLDQSKCIDKLSPQEKQAASVYYLCQALSACGTQTCTVDQLQEDAACLKQVSPNRLQSIGVYTDFLAADAAGASVTLDMDDIQEAIKCLRLIDSHALKAMETVLRCALRECVA